MFGFRFWGVSGVYTLGAALFIGIPTVLIPNSFFVRMTPSSAQDYIIWGLSVLLIGPVMALATLYPTSPRTPSAAPGRSGGIRAFLGTLLAFFSVGCPICNKLVVLLLGVTGAMTIFDPLRPFLGMASLLLLSMTLILRLRVLRTGCPLPLPKS